MKEQQKEKVVLIHSGGLDSTTLLYDLIKQGYDVHPINFNYNQKHKKELEYAIKTYKYLGIENFKQVDLSILGDLAPSALTREDQEVPEGHYESKSMKQTVVPNRNMVMLALATSYAIGIGATKLFYGAHSGDHAIYPDCRPEFIKAMAQTIKLCDWKKVRLMVPYSKKSKIDIVRRGFMLLVEFKLTWSCYNGREKACGRCGACQERLEAFKLNGLIDPLEYE